MIHERIICACTLELVALLETAKLLQCYVIECYCHAVEGVTPVSD